MLSSTRLGRLRYCRAESFAPFLAGPLSPLHHRDEGRTKQLNWRRVVTRYDKFLAWVFSERKMMKDDERCGKKKLFLPSAVGKWDLEMLGLDRQESGHARDGNQLKHLLGLCIDWRYPQKMMVNQWKSHCKMDDDWGYPHFWGNLHNGKKNGSSTVWDLWL